MTFSVTSEYGVVVAADGCSYASASSNRVEFDPDPSSYYLPPSGECELWANPAYEKGCAIVRDGATPLTRISGDRFNGTYRSTLQLPIDAADQSVYDTKISIRDIYDFLGNRPTGSGWPAGSFTVANPL